MKKLIFTSILALLTALLSTVRAQEQPDEYLGLPGDNLNLYAVMKLFQESETLEGFERNLNDENSTINNLDLNGDNMVDYIMVYDYVDRDAHTIVLRVALNENENQDVAVFTVQRLSNGSVQIQLIGDEALYGKNYIVEPIYDDNYGETPNPGYTRQSGYGQNTAMVRTTTYEIAGWPLIRFLFLPNYIAWHSSWNWGYYPSYWNPWRPYYWHFYYGYHSHWYPDYYRHFRHSNYARYARYNDFYYRGLRSYSIHVNKSINEGHYRSTYSHPEQRREGEALFSRVHPDRNRELRDNRVINSQERKSATMSERERGNTGMRYGTVRRPSPSVERKSGTNTPIRQNTGESRESRSKVIERREPGTPSGQSSGIYNRPSSTFSDRTVTRPSNSQATSNSNRSSSVSSGRVVSGPSYNRTSSTSPRSSSVSSERTVSRPSYGQTSSTSRRTPVTISERLSPKPSEGQTSTTSGRSPSVSSERSVSRPSYSQSSNSSRRSPAVSSERVVSKPTSVQKSSSNSKDSSSDKQGRRDRVTETLKSSRR